MINDFAQSLNIPNLYLSHIFYCCLLQHTRTNFFIFQIYWDRSWLRHISADRKRTDRVQWAVHTTKWLPLLRRDWWAVLQFRVFFCCCWCTFVRSATLFKFHAYVHKRKRIKNGSNLLFLLYLLFVYCLELIVVFAKGSRARHTKKCLSNTKAWKKIPNKINKIAGKWQWLDQRHSFSPINIYIGETQIISHLIDLLLLVLANRFRDKMAHPNCQPHILSSIFFVYRLATYIDVKFMNFIRATPFTWFVYLYRNGLWYGEWIFRYLTWD